MRPWLFLSVLGTFFLSIGSVYAQPPAAAKPQRLALLVGISEYPQHGELPWRKLHTSNDVKELRSTLIERYEFKDSDVVVLRDDAATKAGIERAFRTHLIDRARPGDVVLFHFSGHGQQLKDDNGDELDGLDESLVPFDALDRRQSRARTTNIRDDLLGEWLAQLKSKLQVGDKVSGSIVVTLDSCASGTATRGILVERGQHWDEKVDGPRPPAQQRGTRDDSAGFFNEGDAQRLGYVLLAASQSDQTAKEIEEMGVFTQKLVAALRTARSDRSLTYRSLYEQVALAVETSVEFQTPQIEGDADQLVFSGIAVPRADRSLAASLLPNGLLQIAAGSLSGVTQGSVYDLFRRASGPHTPASRLGQATVSAVEPLTATLKATVGVNVQTVLQSDKGGRVVEAQHMPDTAPLRAYVQGLAACKTVYDQLRALTIMTEQRASASSYDVRIVGEAGRIAVYLASAGTRRAEFACSATGAEALRKFLQGRWRWRYLGALRHEDAQAEVRLNIVPVSAHYGADQKVSEQPADRAELQPAPHQRLRQGDFYMLEFTNRSAVPFYINVLELDPHGAVTPFYPKDTLGQDPLLADGKPMRPPFKPYVFTIKDPPGTRLRLKLIASVWLIDLTGAATRTATAPGQALSVLLRNLVEGQRATAGLIDSSLWGTADATIDVVK